MTVSNGYQRFNAHIATANINIQSGGGTGELGIEAVEASAKPAGAASAHDQYLVNWVMDATDRNWFVAGWRGHLPLAKPSTCSFTL